MIVIAKGLRILNQNCIVVVPSIKNFPVYHSECAVFICLTSSDADCRCLCWLWTAPLCEIVSAAAFLSAKVSTRLYFTILPPEPSPTQYTVWTAPRQARYRVAVPTIMVTDFWSTSQQLCDSVYRIPSRGFLYAETVTWSSNAGNDARR